mgnify:CR=1 FL=1
MITIKIKDDNAAFEDNYSKAVNYILLQVQEIANMIEEEPKKLRFPMDMKVTDENGNIVESAKFTR